MKAGVCSYCFNAPLVSGEMSVTDMIAFVGRETEADCVEPLSRYWDDAAPEIEQAREAAGLVQEVGLQVSCYTLDSDFAVYDEAANRECINLCIRRLDTALALGTDTIRLDPRSSLPGDPEQADLDDVLVRVAKGMAEVAAAAAEKGIKVGVENHGTHLGRTAQTQRIVGLVNLPNFGVNIDPTNFRNVFGEDHLAATRLLAPQVVHAHVKDFYYSDEPQDGEGWRQNPAGQYYKRAVGGEGDADWATVLLILKNAGYDGTISLEISDPDDIKGSVAQGVANLRRIIDELDG